MKILGFNLTKISAEKNENFQKSKVIPNIEFINLEKDKADILKENELIKVTFKHDLTYEALETKKEIKQGQINFEGIILLSVSDEESKNLMKSWKKKIFPEELKFSLSNLVLRKCTSKTLQLQDEINLPTHLPMPKLNRTPQNQ